MAAGLYKAAIVPASLRTSLSQSCLYLGPAMIADSVQCIMSWSCKPLVGGHYIFTPNVHS